MSTQDPFVGQVVGGRYEVVARIGRGAMGAIYEVRHTKLKRSFALKRLMPHLADDKEALERFQQEADVVAGLRHPNVVEIVDWETLSDGTPCIVMELLRGENLEQRMRRVGKLAWPELYSIADQVLSALAVAHRAGIVHRDLKPQNIYLAIDDSGDERLKLLDFGISKVQGSGHTSAGAVIGTPAYMAPEQADSRGEDISGATDLWALGAILYELATGTQAFQGASGSAVLYKVCYGATERITGQRPDADPRFVALVEKLLTKPVAERPGDADSVRRVVRELAQAPLPVERPASLADHTITEIRAMPANSTTLSASSGQSIELPAGPPQPRGSRWPVLAGVLALGAIVTGVVALRPAAPRTVPAAQPVVPAVAPVVSPVATVPAKTSAMTPPPAQGNVGHAIVHGQDPAGPDTAKRVRDHKLAKKSDILKKPPRPAPKSTVVPPFENL